MCKAHRVSWVIHYGSIPEGLLVCHKCDNPSCVNPLHLFLGTIQDNNRDRANKGRGNVPKGEDRTDNKLTEQQVREIREKYEPHVYSQERLAKEYGISQGVVWRIIHRKTWKHVE